MLGKWEYRDFVWQLEDYEKGRQLSDITFIDLDIRKNGEIIKSNYIWTKGYFVNLFSYNHIYRYEIAIIGGIEHLLLYNNLDYDNSLYIFERAD